MALSPAVIERSETRVTPPLPPPPLRVITAHPPSKKTLMEEEEIKNRLVGHIIPLDPPGGDPGSSFDFSLGRRGNKKVPPRGQAAGRRPAEGDTSAAR